MKIFQIVAHSENHVIGKNGGIPWKISGDLPRFQKITMGHPVLMGRKTFESMGKYAPLKGRLNIVLTSKPALAYDGDGILTREEGSLLTRPDTELAIANCLEEALEMCQGHPDVYIIGGESLYRETLPYTDEIRLTLVHRVIEDGEAFYPELDGREWRASYIEMHPSGTHTYIDMVRVTPHDHTSV